MDMTPIRSQVAALTAMCQSVILIQNIANGEPINNDELTQLLKGTLITSPDNIFDVYPNIRAFDAGSALLIKQLSGQAKKSDIELTRYLSGIMALSKKVLANTESLEKLKLGIELIERRLDHFEIGAPSIVENFADIYSSAVSPLGQKIQILGSPDVLKQPNVQNKVRALLLAAIRAAVFWRQMGGQRRQFVFSRKQVLQEATLFNKETF